MASYSELIKKSNAYNVIARDKKAGRLSHAYMVVTSDKKYLREYLKTFAKLIMCEEDEFCGICRECRLISEERLTDVHFYPQQDGDKITAEDVDTIVSDSFVKPYECDKKIFVIADATDMNVSAQNKLLKTLEEPPENVYIIIGATSEHAVLSTIKSRVRTVEVSPFTPDELYDALKYDFPDGAKLMRAVRASDGTYGNTTELYEDEQFARAEETAKTVLLELGSSRDTLKVMGIIAESKVDLTNLLNSLEVLFYDMMVYFSDQRLCQNSPNLDFFAKINGFNRASCLYALDRILEAKRKVWFNGNDTMVTERLLLQILEGKYKWKK